MTSSWKTYRVSFTVRDCYFIELKARSEDEALARAEHLYTEHGEEPFTFDISQGGTDEWEAEAVNPRPNHPSNESPTHAGH